MWRQHALAQAQRAQATHLADALQRRFAWAGDHVAIARRSEITFREAGVIVRGADKAVEIDFFRAHDGKPGAGIGAAFSESCVATG